MHVATRLFDVLFPEHPEGENHAPKRPRPVLAPAERARFRQAVRLGVLFHDVGHAPLSHTTELIMPAVRALKIPRADLVHEDQQATHEDYTLKILLDSELARALEAQFGGDGIRGSDVADLVCPQDGSVSPWLVEGMDFGPVLRQLVSSELDADRMDYLQRDSFYSGVNYGKFDADWLIQNVLPVEQHGRIHLGIAARSIFSFEDFLLSRYHMFLTVYYHYTPVCFGEMLARYFQTSPGEYSIPADVEEFCRHDDMLLWMRLRDSTNPWARRICARRSLKLLKDDPRGNAVVTPEQLARVRAAGIDVIEHTSKGVLSKYFNKPDVDPIYVVDDGGGVTPIEEYTPLYKRYAEAVKVYRLYVDPADAERAQALLA